MRVSNLRAAAAWCGRARVSDLETPVSALLKFGPHKPGAFLLESVQGGDFRGRYSIIGLKPDLVWRVKNGRAEISRGGFADSAFRPQREAPIKSLRKAAGAFGAGFAGAVATDGGGAVRLSRLRHGALMEHLPDAAPDPIGTPEALLMRPTVICVFDNVTSEITLVTPARTQRQHRRRCGLCERLQAADGRVANLGTSAAPHTDCSR